MLLCGAGVFACLLLAGCAKPKEAEAEPVAPVQVAPAARATVRRIITANGVLYPRDQSSIMPKISAPVKRFFVNRGDRVTAGQLLAQLENRDLIAAAVDGKGQFEQAQANYRTVTAATLPEELTKSQQDVDAAREGLDAARKVYESRQQLLREGAIARKLVDDAAVALAQAKSQYETALKHLETLKGPGRTEQVKGAEAQVESARGRYEAAQAQVGYSEIHSPVAGVVADRPLYAGEMANAGSPLISVMDISTVVARVNVPSSDANAVRRGASATIHGPGGDLDGKVTVVSPAVDPQSTTLEIWVEAPNPKGLLKPGASVQASILAQTIPNALVVPASAILSSQDGSTEVLVITPDSAAHERKVQTGVKDGDNVQVLSGVNDGDNVVTVGGLGVQDGAKVRVERPGASGKGESEKGEKREETEKPEKSEAGGK